MLHDGCCRDQQGVSQYSARGEAMIPLVPLPNLGRIGKPKKAIVDIIRSQFSEPKDVRPSVPAEYHRETIIPSV